MNKYRLRVYTCSLLLFSSSAHALDSPPQEVKLPIVESIQGTDSIELILGKKKRPVTPGTTIQVGETLKTGARSSAVIQYPDGSKITVTFNSEYSPEGEIEGVKVNKLKSGSVRGIIQKIEAKSNRPHFIIRAKSAVLGVRGTDFVMALANANQAARVHTLEGSVEVAKSEVSLMSGKGTTVRGGEFVQTAKGGVTPPQAFDKGQFLQNFETQVSPNAAPPAPSAPAGSAMPTASVPGAPGGGVSAPAVGLPSGGVPTPSLGLPSVSLGQSQDDAPKVPQKKEKKAEEPDNRFNLLAFQFGYFFTELQGGKLNGTIVRSLHAVWAPTFPMPFLPFLTLRGGFGGNFAQDFDFTAEFRAVELQAYVRMDIPGFFGEVGFGKQIWLNSLPFDGLLATVNAGVRLPLGIIDYAFVGFQMLSTEYRPKMAQFKLGIGITF